MVMVSRFHTPGPPGTTIKWGLSAASSCHEVASTGTPTSVCSRPDRLAAHPISYDRGFARIAANGIRRLKRLHRPGQVEQGQAVITGEEDFFRPVRFGGHIGRI